MTTQQLQSAFATALHPTTPKGEGAAALRVMITKGRAMGLSSAEDFLAALGAPKTNTVASPSYELISRAYATQTREMMAWRTEAAQLRADLDHHKALLTEQRAKSHESRLAAKKAAENAALQAKALEDFRRADATRKRLARREKLRPLLILLEKKLREEKQSRLETTAAAPAPRMQYPALRQLASALYTPYVTESVPQRPAVPPRSTDSHTVH